MTSAPWRQTPAPWRGKQSERACFFSSLQNLPTRERAWRFQNKKKRTKKKPKRHVLRPTGCEPLTSGPALRAGHERGVLDCWVLCVRACLGQPTQT